MFRPRRPVRPFRRLMRAGGLLGARPRQLLAQAHALAAAGRHQEAAQMFEQLAATAVARGMLDRAGNLSLQAARAYVESGDTQKGLAHVRQGLRQLQQAGRELRAAKALHTAVAAFRAHGLTAEADALEKEFANLPGDGASNEPAPRAQLPSKCPHCGGPLRSDEAEWIDERSAECPYCGTPVAARDA